MKGSQTQELSASSRESLARSSAGLLFYSALIFCGGIQRAQIYTFFLSAGTALTFPPSVLLLAALVEVTMGLVGLVFAGAAAMQYRVPSYIAWAVWGLMMLAAWFIFLIFVFIQPGMDATGLPGTPEPFTSRQIYNTFVMSGILAAAFYCASLLGGYLSFMWYIVHLYGNPSKDLGVDQSYWAFRARYFSTLVLLTGIFILTAGFCATSVDPGPHEIAAPPIFIVWSGIPIATGFLAILTGGVGLVVGLLPKSPVLALLVAALTALNTLWQISVMSLYQPPAQGNFVAALPVAILILSQVAPAYYHLMRTRSDVVAAGVGASFSETAVPLVKQKSQTD